MVRWPSDEALHHTVHSLYRPSFYLVLYLLSDSLTSTHFGVQAQSTFLKKCKQHFMFGPFETDLV